MALSEPAVCAWALQMLSADFCMDPALYAVQVVPAGAVQDNLAYYLSCSGVNPAGPSVLEARVSAQQLNATLATLTSTTCPGNRRPCAVLYYAVPCCAELTSVDRFAEQETRTSSRSTPPPPP